jgi:hypothetical protein
VNVNHNCQRGSLKTTSNKHSELINTGFILSTSWPKKTKLQMFLMRFVGKGRALIPILYQMAKFSIQYCPKDVFKDKKPRTVEELFGYEPDSNIIQK